MIPLASRQQMPRTIQNLLATRQALIMLITGQNIIQPSTIKIFAGFRTPYLALEMLRIQQKHQFFNPAA